MEANHGEFESYPLRTWDEGWGKLWLFIDACGAWLVPRGVIRASTWEEAWECATDEIMDDADPEDASTWARDYDDTAEPEDLAEGCYWRGSGEPSNESLHSPIATCDPWDARLEPVSKALLDRFHVRVSLRDEG